MCIQLLGTSRRFVFFFIDSTDNRQGIGPHGTTCNPSRSFEFGKRYFVVWATYQTKFPLGSFRLSWFSWCHKEPWVQEPGVSSLPQGCILQWDNGQHNVTLSRVPHWVGTGPAEQTHRLTIPSELHLPEHGLLPPRSNHLSISIASSCS